MTKLCKYCDETKPETAFSLDSEGYRCARCRDCTNTYNRSAYSRTLRKAGEARRRMRGDEALKAKQIRKATLRAERYPEKELAKRIVRQAIVQRRLVRPAHCSQCGSEPSPKRNGVSRIQAHHADYSKPLDVMWLCEPCHHKEHGSWTTARDAVAPPVIAEKRENS